MWEVQLLGWSQLAKGEIRLNFIIKIVHRLSILRLKWIHLIWFKILVNKSSIETKEFFLPCFLKVIFFVVFIKWFMITFCPLLFWLLKKSRNQTRKFCNIREIFFLIMWISFESGRRPSMIFFSNYIYFFMI